MNSKLETRNPKQIATSSKILPLTMAASGEILKLVKITAGRRLRRRLIELGLTPGTELAIVQNNGGAMLLSVRDTRLALGKGMAHKIFVEIA